MNRAKLTMLLAISFFLTMSSVGFSQGPRGTGNPPPPPYADFCIDRSNLIAYVDEAESTQLFGRQHYDVGEDVEAKNPLRLTPAPALAKILLGL